MPTSKGWKVKNGCFSKCSGALHKLDLNDASPSWSHVSYVDGSGNGYQANGGLVGYTDSRGDTKLFALKMWICNLSMAGTITLRQEILIASVAVAFLARLCQPVCL